MLTRTVDESYRIGASPTSAVVSALPIVCFAGALVTDVAYWRTSDIQWANFSAWLLAVGMALGGFYVLVEIVSLLRLPAHWRTAGRWSRLALIVIALAVALVDNFVHARDGWTSVVPTGLILSAVTVLLLIAAAFIGVTAADDVARGGPA